VIEDFVAGLDQNPDREIKCLAYAHGDENLVLRVIADPRALLT